MSKLTICFPGGAGGNWLSSLILSLESNSFVVSNSINYHRHRKSPNVVLTHDVDTRPAVFLNGQGLFNIYLNVVKKLRFSDQNMLKNYSIRDCFETLASEASSKLLFANESRDLDWDNIFLNPELFVQNLFNILDQHNLQYTKNSVMCMSAINEYKVTCVDPTDHYDNFESIYWLGWCNGICKHEFQDWPLVDRIDQIQEFLLPRREFFKEYTKQYIIQ